MSAAGHDPTPATASGSSPAPASHANPATAAESGPAPAPRSPTRLFASVVLAFEALVVFFAGLVAKDLSSAPAGTALIAAGLLAVLCLVTIGMLRSRAGYALGSVLQLVLIGTGFWVPAMFFLGAVFGALWVLSLRLGARITRERAARAAQAAGG